MKKIKVIIPAYNEEESIVKVIKDIPKIVDEVIVVNNNSSDQTKEFAKKAGATVLTENRRGYGLCLLKGYGLYLFSRTKNRHYCFFRWRL